MGCGASIPAAWKQCQPQTAGVLTLGLTYQSPLGLSLEVSHVLQLSSRSDIGLITRGNQDNIPVNQLVEVDFTLAFDDTAL